MKLTMLFHSAKPCLFGLKIPGLRAMVLPKIWRNCKKMSFNSVLKSTKVVPIAYTFSLFGLFNSDVESPEQKLITTIKRCLLCIQQEQYDKAEQMLHLALRMAQDMQSRDGITYVYDIMANLAMEREQFKKAEKLFVDVMRILLSDGLPEDNLKICDHRMRIRYARYAGSSHDSLIWNVSPVRQVLRKRYESGERNCWLLGDAGYPLEPYLMTPYRSAQERSPEAVFNSKHATARNIIERTFGVLKNRFRCLLGARQLYYSPGKATKIVNVCAALHNVCIEYSTFIEDYVMPTNTENSNNIFDTNPKNLLNNEASQIRDEIKNIFL